MQDAIAITIAVAAALWLTRTLWRQMIAPSCGKASNPAGSDGFVPLGDLSLSAKKSGRPSGRPDS